MRAHRIPSRKRESHIAALAIDVPMATVTPACWTARLLSHFSSGTKARLVENDRTQRRKLVWDFSVAIKYFPTSEHVLVLNF